MARVRTSAGSKRVPGGPAAAIVDDDDPTAIGRFEGGTDRADIHAANADAPAISKIAAAARRATASPPHAEFRRGPAFRFRNSSHP
jgi:hypothetical protein